MDEARDRFFKMEGWKSLPADAWNWFLAARVPLRGLVGVPTLYLALVNRRRLFREFIDGTGVAGHFMTRVAAFLVFLPASLADVFFRDELLDSPMPLWIARFWAGFSRGLDRYADYFVDEGDENDENDDEEEPFGFAEFVGAVSTCSFGDDEDDDDKLKEQTAVWVAEYAPRVADFAEAVFNWRVGEDEDDDKLKEQTAAWLAEYAPRVAEFAEAVVNWCVGDDEDRARRPGRADPAQTRTGREAHSLAAELGFWAACVRRTAPVFVGGGAVLLAVYVLCQFVVAADSPCGTSFVCGGPDGGGMYRCLWYAEAAIREASEVASRPLRYRFFQDGTRLLFPDR
ncbi:hypothetical protein F4824DRAFT_501150 [Ustulina deusta]|nr:hypothetical protein F4824DRAFT_501150 [Ustulina deusta]